MQPKKHLRFGNLRKTISERALQIEDPRRGGSVDHDIHDCCLSGFAMMFFQDPSMLAFQGRLQEDGHKNNLQTIFRVGSIPKATQLRDVIDLIPSSSFDPIFSEHNYGHGTQYASFNFLLFILLAFFVHQILELSDPLYQNCRSTFSSRVDYWNHLRCAIRIHIFCSFEHLLEFMITATKDPQPP